MHWRLTHRGLPGLIVLTTNLSNFISGHHDPPPPPLLHASHTSPARMPFLKVLSSCPQGVLHKLPLLLITFFPRLFICTTCSFSSWRCQLTSPPQRSLPWLLTEKNFHLLFFTTVNCWFCLFVCFNITLTFLLGCLIGNSNLPSPKLISQLSHFDLPPSFNSG